MDRITEELLKTFATENALSLATEDDIATAFEHMCNYACVSEFVSNAFQLEDIHTGGGDDTGCDGIAIIVNGVLVTDAADVDAIAATAKRLDVDYCMLQTKRSSSFSGSDISNFLHGVKDFFSTAPRLPRNSFVTQAALIHDCIIKHAKLLTSRNPNLHLFYITTGTWNNDTNLQSRFDVAIEDLQQTNLFEEIEAHPYGARDIQAAYKQAGKQDSCEFNFVNKLTIESEQFDEAYLGFIPATEFVKIVSDPNGLIKKSVFYDNVRDFQDYNDVNTSIQQTLQSNTKGRFIALNNGVTIITKSIRFTSNKCFLDDYQIVNGCQTSHVIFDEKPASDSVQVPIKIVCTTDTTVVNEIIRGTNNQTEVKPQQLYALSDFQKQLEEFYSTYHDTGTLHYERRAKQYSTTTGIEKTRIVSIQQQLRVFASMFLNMAHKGHYARALDSEVGSTIFCEGHKLEPYYCSSLAYYKLEYFFRNRSIDAKYKPARFAILMAARILFDANTPHLASNKMRTYANRLIACLLDDATALDLFNRTLPVIDAVAGTTPIDRSLTKTKDFTDAVLVACRT